MTRIIQVIVEIELYWFTAEQRKRKDYFSLLIYYYASPDAIEKRREKSLKEKEREEKRRGSEKMERGKIEKKEQKELERLKGIVRDQYKEKKNAYRKKVCEIMQNFLTFLSASLDKETENFTVERVAKEILLLRKGEFLDIETYAVSLDQEVVIKS